MSEVLVAIICNVVMALILIGGILSSLNYGWKVSLTKLVITLGGAVATYFLTPILSNKIWEVKGVSTLAIELGISQVTVNSCIFLLLFILSFGVSCIIASFVKHALIKGMSKSSSENRAKIKRAKSINPKAERMARKTIWRELVTEYKGTNTIGKKLLSVFLGIVLYACVSFTMLLPMNYVIKDLNNKNDNKYAYLEQGYEYTLNGVIGEDVADFIVSAPKVEVEKEQPGEEETPEVGVE